MNELKNDPPLYVQVYTTIRKRIESGEYPPRTLIPSEATLIRELNVSQITVRRALLELQTAGYVRKKQGIGTFVLPDRKQDNSFQLISLTEQIRKQGKVAHSVILSLEKVPASIEVAEALQVLPGEPTTFLRRLRFASDDIVGLNETYINPFLGIDLNLSNFHQNDSLYKFLASNNVEIFNGTEILEVIMPTPRLKAELSLSKMEPLLFRKRTTFTEAGVPVECSYNYYPAKDFKFTIQLQKEE